MGREALRGKRDGNLAQRHPAIAILDGLGEKDHVRVALDVLTGFNAASPWPSEVAAYELRHPVSSALPPKILEPAQRQRGEEAARTRCHERRAEGRWTR
jgi:hypothetical protein